MVKIRLRRRGRKQHPIYDIVAMHSRKRRDGEYIEKLGQYNPMTRPSTIILDHERALYWLKSGAQPTDVTRKLLSIEGVLLRQYMEMKGKTQEEITSALEVHRATVQSRAQRMIAKRERVRLATKAADAKPESAE